MNLGSAYLEIADKLGVTTKVLDGMRKVITDTTRRIIDRSDQPSERNARVDQLVSTILKTFDFSGKLRAHSVLISNRGQ